MFGYHETSDCVAAECMIQGSLRRFHNLSKRQSDGCTWLHSRQAGIQRAAAELASAENVLIMAALEGLQSNHFEYSTCKLPNGPTCNMQLRASGQVFTCN